MAVELDIRDTIMYRIIRNSTGMADRPGSSGWISGSCWWNYPFLLKHYNTAKTGIPRTDNLNKEDNGFRVISFSRGGLGIKNGK